MSFVSMTIEFNFALFRTAQVTQSYFLTCARRGRTGLGWGVLSLVVAATTFLALAVCVTLVLFLLKWIPGDFARRITDASFPTYFYGGAAIAFGLLIVGVASGAAWVQRKNPADLLGRWRWSEGLRGFATWFLVLGALSGGDYLLNPRSFHWTADRRLIEALLIAAPSLAIQTFAE